MITEKGRVRVYCAGGAGINIGVGMEQYRDKSEDGIATIEIAYVDTSRSNLSRHAELAGQHKNCYIIDGLDGSGKVRSENYHQISERIRDIIQQFKPADLNIVVSSGAGGSGSVIAPSIVAELLDRNLPVIVMIVGSTATKLETENTLKTIKSYESIATKRQVPIIATYVENSDKVTRAEADAHLKHIMMGLAILFSRENHEMDSKDLFNWLHYEKVTSFKPALAALTMMEVNDLPKELTSIGNVISVATLTNEHTSASMPVRPEYQCIGYLPEQADSKLRSNSPYHFAISDGIYHETAHRLQTILDELTESQQARVVKRSILTANDKQTDSGIVL